MSALPTLDAVLDSLAERIAARVTMPERSSAEWLTVDQTAHELKVAVSTLEIWRSKGKGPPFHKLARNNVRYKRSDLEAFLEANKHNSPARIRRKR